MLSTTLAKCWNSGVHRAGRRAFKRTGPASPRCLHVLSEAPLHIQLVKKDISLLWLETVERRLLPFRGRQGITRREETHHPLQIKQPEYLVGSRHNINLPSDVAIGEQTPVRLAVVQVASCIVEDSQVSTLEFTVDAFRVLRLAKAVIDDLHRCSRGDFAASAHRQDVQIG